MFLASALTAPAALADTLSFSFSFTGNVTNGMVTGTIEGLQDNATSAATALYIDTATNAPANDLLPYNVLGGPIGSSSNSFTVTNGVITGANFFLVAGGADSQEPDFGAFSLSDGSPYDLLNFRGPSGGAVENSNGLSGVTYQLLSRTAHTRAFNTLLRRRIPLRGRRAGMAKRM